MKRNLSIILLLGLLLTIVPFYSQQTTTLTPIKHVIVIILENHSFDNIYGKYPFGNPPIYNNITMSVMVPVGVNTSAKLPNGEGGYSSPYYANSVILPDPTEGYKAYHIDWDYGRMDGFVIGSGHQSLAYLSYEQVPLLWDYAEEYVLADDYFSPVLAPTQPNRVSYLTGFPTNIIGDGFVSGVIPFNETIMYQLSEYGISWAYFDYGYKQSQPLPPFPLTVFKGAEQYSSHYYNTSVFLEDLEDGNLPSVSWLMFTGGNGYDTHSPLDMHPPFNLTIGQENLAYYIDKVMESPYWNSTAIFITFDEGGGFYDQVPPPIIPTYGIGCDLFLKDHGIQGYTLLGQRIPLLIISPYAKEGWIDNYTLSGYSLLAFIDYNWHLPYLNPIVGESDVQGILQAFNFSQPPRPPVILTPENWTYPVPLQYPVHYGYVAKVYNNYTAYELLNQKGYINSSTLYYLSQFGYVETEKSPTNQVTQSSGTPQQSSSVIISTTSSPMSTTTAQPTHLSTSSVTQPQGNTPLEIVTFTIIVLVISVIVLRIIKSR
ncbi:phospholipase C [Stygiolobus caldivivus]|uniref:Phosphoesterase n=1 Tax=Stygiolobus caldivivus TaxID=2824673 RepID=A0A8D5ZIP0_9CREN|nr:alkaline phosphatase family protein [Stygiolobus caldivivus]BCU69570.1 hypothetical protein KN1_08670 [Stygiolobus caldivivus]